MLLAILLWGEKPSLDMSPSSTGAETGMAAVGNDSVQGIWKSDILPCAKVLGEPSTRCLMKVMSQSRTQKKRLNYFISQDTSSSTVSTGGNIGNCAGGASGASPSVTAATWDSWQRPLSKPCAWSASTHMGRVDSKSTSFNGLGLHTNASNLTV